MNLVNHLRHFFGPQETQHTLRKRYHTRASGKSLGNLKGFVNLPIDIALEVSIRFKYHKTLGTPSIFAQIARYLRPYDLLQLSRLSKQFRSIFGSRSALFIWRAAFRNLNIRCPANLSELQFASLLHDYCCMVQSTF